MDAWDVTVDRTRVRAQRRPPTNQLCLHPSSYASIQKLSIRLCPHVSDFILKTEIFALVWLTVHTYPVKRSPKTRLFKNALQSLPRTQASHISFSRTMHTCFMGIFLHPRYNAQIQSGFSQTLRSKLSRR